MDKSTIRPLEEDNTVNYKWTPLSDPDQTITAGKKICLVLYLGLNKYFCSRLS